MLVKDGVERIEIAVQMQPGYVLGPARGQRPDGIARPALRGPAAPRLRRRRLALLIVDWTIAGTTSDGEEIAIRGTATDVARRGEDGVWRCVIDNPFGTATHGP